MRLGYLAAAMDDAFADSHMRFTLTFDDAVLPPWNAIKMTIRDGVSASRSLHVTPAGYDPEEALAVLSAVYCSEASALWDVATDSTFRIECTIGRQLEMMLGEIDNITNPAALLGKLDDILRSHKAAGDGRPPDG